MTKQGKGMMRTALALAIASSVLVGCGSDSSSSGGGNLTVKLYGGVGGNGAGNTGGNGNDFELTKEAGAGDVKVLRSGSVNASFNQLSITPSFGSVSAVISTNTDLSTSMLADCAPATVAPAAGTLYQVANDSRLFKSNGVATPCETAEVVTGLDVQSGATLKLALNWSGATWSYINLDADIRNNGTITVADVNATQRGSIDLEPINYTGTGKIETQGTLVNQSGGDIYLYTDYGLVNSGAMNASGGAATAGNGGNAGYIYLEGYYYTQNTGDLTANGGNTTAAAGVGGNGDYIQLYSGWGPVYNSGKLTGLGGEGATGGSGASIYLESRLGNMFNSGAIAVYGANSTVGNGGNGGYVEAQSDAGEIRNSGDVKAWGGNTTATAGNGGNGDELYVYSEDEGISEDSPAGDIHWSGEIDLHGGDAVATGTGNGGSAGNVSAEIYGYSVNIESELAFVGYSAVHTYGGDGNHGGQADGYFLYNEDSYVSGDDDSAPTPGGSVISEADVVAHGGNARTGGADINGNGGRGGSIYLETGYYPTALLVPDSQMTKHSGNVDISGGNGRNQTGYNNYSGNTWFWGYNGSAVTGNVTMNGGDDLGATTGPVGYGGYTNEFYVYSELGDAKASGTVAINGGDGNYRGGWSSGAYIYGNTVHVSGKMDANGGNARVAEASSIGGYGGYLELKAIHPENSSATTTATYAGGTGATAGSEGAIVRLISCSGADC